MGDSHTDLSMEMLERPNRIYTITSYHIHNPTMAGVTKLVEEIQMVDGVTLTEYQGDDRHHRYYGESSPDPTSGVTKQVSVYVHYPYAPADATQNGTNI